VSNAARWRAGRYAREILWPNSGVGPEDIDLTGSYDAFVTRALEANMKRQPVDWLFCYTYNALVPHAKLMKSTEALWTKVLPKFM
jgi:hypothetical protein